MIMKSNLFLLIATSLLLVGCTTARAESISDSQKEESQSGDTSSTTDGSQSEESSTTSEGSEDNSEIEGTQTFKAQFYTPSGNASKTNSDSSNFTTKMQDYFLEDNDQQLLKNASAPNGYAQINEIDDAKNCTMILGSKNNDGILKLDFYCYIVSIKVEAQAYCKYVSYTDTWNIDADCSLSVDGQEGVWSLPSGEGEASPIQTKSYSFDTAVNTLKFTNGGTNKRVFIHSLEITYCIY